MKTIKISLFESNPELCDEWDFEQNMFVPKEVATHIDKIVWWKCIKYNFKCKPK
ncbi:MAG: zinc-ribbon domain-containing protein [Patescibacteria group bacterium]|jgi:hypothetical protein